MKSFKTHASDLTRERYRALWPQLSDGEADRHGVFSAMADDVFDRFGGPGGTALDPEIVAVIA